VGAGHHIYQRVFGPMVGLKTIPDEIAKKERQLAKSLKYLDNVLSKTAYLCGDSVR